MNFRLHRPAPLEDDVLWFFEQMLADHHWGGLVPVATLRAVVRESVPGYRREDFDRALYALETAGKLQLSVAESPSRVPDREGCIEHPRRGLIAWATRAAE